MGTLLIQKPKTCSKMRFILKTYQKTMEWLHGLGGHRRPPQGDNVGDGSEMRTRQQDPGGHAPSKGPPGEDGEGRKSRKLQ